MVTTKLQAYTLNDEQPVNWPYIRHYGYTYSPFEDNPQVPEQSSSGFWVTQNPPSYLLIGAGGATSSITPYIKQNMPLTLRIESPNEQINPFMANYYVILTFDQEHLNAPYYADETGTLQVQVIKDDSYIEQRLNNLLRSYGHEEFDSDIAYYFTNDITELVLEYGNPLIKIIRKIINRDIINHDMTNELFKAIGRIEDTQTKDFRYTLLMNSLKNDSATIRDGAVSGLSFLDDKMALPQLRALYEKETAPIFKRNIKVAIENLEM